MKSKKLYLMICFLGLALTASPALALDDEDIDELLEQDFQTINLDNDSSNGDNAEAKFEFVDPSLKGKSVKQISVKNELPESVKLVLVTDDEAAQIKTRELYLNAYETKDLIDISSGIQYRAEVYNLYNSYLGQIYRADLRTKNKLSISPFFLIKDVKLPKPITAEAKPEKKEVKKESKKSEEKESKKVAKEQKPKEEKVKEEEKEAVAKVEEKESAIPDASAFKSIEESEVFSQEITTKREIDEKEFFNTQKTAKTSSEKKAIEEKPTSSSSEPPQPKEIVLTSKKAISELPLAQDADDSARNIKIANISEEVIHIDLVDSNGSPIGTGWTINNDNYVPQYLNLNAEPIKVDPEVKLLINNSKSKESITKFAKELNVDEQGNYVWFVD